MPVSLRLLPDVSAQLGRFALVLVTSGPWRFSCHHAVGLELKEAVSIRRNHCRSELDRDGITLFEKKPPHDG